MSTQPYSELPTNNKEEEQKQSDKRSKLIYITIFTIVLFALEVFVRDPYTNLSEAIQEKLNFPYKCEIGDAFVYFKYKGKSLIFLLLFNISNIFVSLSLIILDSFGIFINGSLKLIYLSPRPFWVNKKLTPCTCATNYGSPSTTGLDVYLVCIVVYRALINRSNKKSWKVLVWIFFLGPQTLAWVSRFIQNLHSLHQLTFGTLTGYVIQYVYFEILEIDMENSAQLKKLVTNANLILTTLLTFVAWLFFNAIHYYLVHVKENKEMNELIGQYCSTTIQYFWLDNESYQKTAKSFLFMGALIGVLLEYNLVFGGDYEKYEKYNMGDERWTETDKYRTVLRMISMHAIGVVILHIPKWGSKKHDDVFSLNFSKLIVANTVKGIFYFYFIKSVFRWLTISNESSGVIPTCNVFCEEDKLKDDNDAKQKLLDGHPTEGAAQKK